MRILPSTPVSLTRAVATGTRVVALAAMAAAVQSAYAAPFSLGDLIVSGSVYQDTGAVAGLVAGTSLLPGKTVGTTVKAAADGQYQNVWANASVDGSFGVTSQIFLQDWNTAGTAPTASYNSQINIDPTQVVTSFPSKSELALNVSSDGNSITFVGYSPVSDINKNPISAANNIGQLDISNSNTPSIADPTNPVQAVAYRAVAQIDLNTLTNSAVSATGTAGVYNLNNSALKTTLTNAYDGNNGRAAALVGANYVMVGNANNGTSTTAAIVQNTGVQLAAQAAVSGTVAPVTTVGACSGTPGAAIGYQCGFSAPVADKSGKDNNYRGLTVYNGSVYVSKGSGGNGVNTVYQVSVPGGGPLTAANAATATITPLAGFPATGTSSHPFGMFFADANTMYVADEGDGVQIGGAGKTNNGGLQKWSFDKGSSQWVLDYTLTAGLGLGTQYSVSGLTNAGLDPYTDGLRNISGRVNADGTVTIYAVTAAVTNSAVGKNWDDGANANKIVAINDSLAATTSGQVASEAFTTLATATAGTVYRGLAIDVAAVPEPSTWGLMGAGLGMVALVLRRRSARLA